MDVSLLQAEATGDRAVADALGKEGEGQQHCVGQRDAGASRQPRLAEVGH